MQVDLAVTDGHRPRLRYRAGGWPSAAGQPGRSESPPATVPGSGAFSTPSRMSPDISDSISESRLEPAGHLELVGLNGDRRSHAAELPGAGYPVAADEFSVWETEQAWGDE